MRKVPKRVLTFLETDAIITITVTITVIGKELSPERRIDNLF